MAREFKDQGNNQGRDIFKARAIIDRENTEFGKVQRFMTSES